MGFDHDAPKRLEVLLTARQAHPADSTIQDVVDLSPKDSPGSL
jgi:hypothetical protein